MDAVAVVPPAPAVTAPIPPIPPVPDAIPVIKPYVEVPEWLAPIRTALTDRLGAEKLARLDDILQETGAIIAGGSILAAASPWNPTPTYVANPDSLNDMDIYVPTRTSPRFIAALFTGPDPLFLANSYKVVPASRYCESFLRKNGIRRVNTFKLPAGTMDVMTVRNRRTPEQVVTNFDLTFCQIWYDGVHVYATDPEDIRLKRGTLQADYVEALRSGNNFLSRRMRKYIQRGYTILVDGTPYNPATFHGTWRQQWRLRRDNKYKWCYAPGMSASRRSIPEYWIKWLAQVFMAWAVRTELNIPLGFKAISMIIPVNEPLNTINIIVPLQLTLNSINHMYDTWDYKSWRPIPSFWTEYSDTGYDSEDYEHTENQQFLAKRIMTAQGHPDVSPENALALTHNKLLELQLFPTKYIRKWKYISGYETQSYFYTLGTLYYNQQIQRLPGIQGDAPKLSNDVVNDYMDHLTQGFSRRTPTPLEFAEANSRIYDIHVHPLEAAISKEKLMDYLRRHKLFPKDKIPCYWKPCKKLLTFSEIYEILGPTDYNAWHNLAIQDTGGKWQGFTKGDIQFLDVIFDKEGKPAIDTSCCPICLSYVLRGPGCNFIGEHKCPTMNVYYSRSLYDRYKQPDGTIQWCSQCGRISRDHAHYHLGLADAAIPDRFPFKNPFVRDCREIGGGSLPEKFMRFSMLREKALELQDKVHLESANKVKEALIRAVWNAPLTISPEIKAEAEAMFPPLAPPRAFPVARNNVVSFPFNASRFPLQIPPPPVNTSVNRANNLVYPPVPYPNAGNPALLPVIHAEGFNAVLLEDVPNAIQFRHRQQDGTIKEHADEYIALNRLFERIQATMAGTDAHFGQCWDYPVCKARIYPEELEHVLDNVTNLPAETMANYRQILERYTQEFNRQFARQSGGSRTYKRNMKKSRKQKGGTNTPFFVEATDAHPDCPPIRSRNFTRKSRKPRKRMTRRR